MEGWIWRGTFSSFRVFLLLLPGSIAAADAAAAAILSGSAFEKQEIDRVQERERGEWEKSQSFAGD